MNTASVQASAFRTGVKVVAISIIISSMTLCRNIWVLDLVMLMLILRPLELVTASIADDVGQREVGLDVGCHMRTVSQFWSLSAVAPVANKLYNLPHGLPTNVVLACMSLY
jgi:hypothetical protein